MTGPRVDPMLQAARDLLVVRLNKGVNLLAGRTDLIASVEWNARPDSPPAWFRPRTAEVFLNGVIALAGADPAEVNPLTPAGRRRHPVLVGLLCHETGHAAYTRWGDGLGEQVPAPVVMAAILLEDIRIEKRHLERRPGDRIFLRAASRHLDLPPANSMSPTAVRWQAAQAAVLTLGRADAGVLDPADVRKVVTMCRNTLGREALTALRALWREALVLADGDATSLLGIAARWVDVVGVTDPRDVPRPRCARGMADEAGSAAATSGHASSVESSDSPGGEGPAEGGTPDGGVPGDVLSAAFQAAMVTVADRGIKAAAAQLADAAEAEAAHAAEADRRAADERERDAADKAAAEVFHGYSASGTAAPIGKPREATSQERILANRTGEALRRAQFRERAVTVTATQEPPGRLSGRDAMLGAAQRALGMPVTAKPFRRLVRRHTPQPPLTVGIMVDISGSMGWATKVMAAMAWVVAHAVAYVGGRSATVLFGQRVTALTMPGQVPAQVPSFVARDGCEMFTDAARALDGALRLTSARGARLLFVVSDGHFVAPGEMKRAARMVNRLVTHGVIVLWLDLRRGGSSHTRVPAGAIPLAIADVADIPTQVESALVEALRAQ